MCNLAQIIGLLLQHFLGRFQFFGILVSFELFFQLLESIGILVHDNILGQLRPTLHVGCAFLDGIGTWGDENGHFKLLTLFVVQGSMRFCMVERSTPPFC